MNEYSNLTSSRQPDQEICKCSGRPAIVLQSTLTNNPLACADCNLEVNLNQLNFSNELIAEIIKWQTLFASLYKHWLDSGDQEEFAKEQLSSVESEVNKTGLTLNQKIKQTHECYYWWFVDNSINQIRLFKCPNCNLDLIKRKNKFNVDTYICRNCNIIVTD